MALKAGVVGLRMGRAHVEGYRAHPETEVVVVCDTDGARAAEVAAEFGVPRHTTDYREALGAGIDLVSIASPDAAHPEQCVAALEQGKHVLCEKPLALTFEGLEAIVRAADAADAKFMVGQVCRHAPGFALTRRLVEDGLIGRLFFVESEYAHNYERVRGVNDWRVDPLRHPFVGGACHAVDLLRWIAGDVEECHAYANHFNLPDWPVDDTMIASFRFRSGAIGKVFCSIGCRRPYTMRSCFYGDQGTIISDNTSDAIQVYSTRYGGDPGRFVSMPVNVASHNVSSEIAEFVDAIVHDRHVPTDAREGARTIATCLAAVESAAAGAAVKVRDVF